MIRRTSASGSIEVDAERLGIVDGEGRALQPGGLAHELPLNAKFIRKPVCYDLACGLSVEGVKHRLAVKVAKAGEGCHYQKPFHAVNMATA